MEVGTRHTLKFLPVGIDRFEAQLQEIKDKLPNPRALKKIEKVHEKVGKIKAQLSRVG